MPKIVIIGNSAAGFFCCQNLSAKNLPGCEITLISQEDSLPYRKNLLADYLADNIREQELFLCDKNFFETNRINFLAGVKVARVDTKKQSVILKDSNRLNYDYLVIASGQKIDFPDIPGNSKDGVFGFYSKDDTDKIKQRLKIIDSVSLVGAPELCLRLGQVISARGKEVKIISSPRPDSFMAGEKLEWIDNAEVAEIIGEGQELKAIKLSGGKALAASLVLFAGVYSPSTEFLRESKIEMQQDYLLVNDELRTNIENIFSCGTVCRKISDQNQLKNWDQASAEGVAVSESLIRLLERGKTLCQQTS